MNSKSVKKLGSWIRIDIQAKTKYTCSKYQDKLVRKHLVAECLKDSEGLEDLEAFLRIFLE